MVSLARFRVSVVKSTITGTRLAAAPAERITRSSSAGVNSSGASSIMVALSSAESSFRSFSVMFSGSLMSLFTTSSVESIITRIKLPAPARIRSNRLTVMPPRREDMEIAGRSVAWLTSFATFSTTLSTRCIFSSRLALMERVSSRLRR